MIIHGVRFSPAQKKRVPLAYSLKLQDGVNIDTFDEERPFSLDPEMERRYYVHEGNEAVEKLY